MGLLSALWSELLTIYHIIFHRISGTSHKERLESFYKSQARAGAWFSRHRRFFPLAAARSAGGLPLLRRGACRGSRARAASAAHHPRAFLFCWPGSSAGPLAGAAGRRVRPPCHLLQ